MAKKKKCKNCGINEAQDPHLCPYQEDVNGDDNPKFCTCCKECVRVCADEI